jgi:hypothetical protein
MRPRRIPACTRLRMSIAPLALLASLACVTAAPAMTSHAGWPTDQHLVMDKGPAGVQNTLVGENGVHNYLLGGYGDDTIYGGNAATSASTQSATERPAGFAT